jgi:hypothetical protein
MKADVDSSCLFRSGDVGILGESFGGIGWLSGSETDLWKAKKVEYRSLGGFGVEPICHFTSGCSKGYIDSKG